MFTGIITHLGRLKEIKQSRYTISCGQSFLVKIEKGESVAINGICLTVVDKQKDSFSIDCIPETKLKTNIKYLKVGDLVNLELPATYESFLSGHIVEGHVDGTGQLKSIKKQDNSHVLKFSVAKELSKYIVNKGPIAINGISLTAIEAGKDFFTVGIVPYTWSNTMLYTLQLRDYVNIELDLLAKYVEKLIRRT